MSFSHNVRLAEPAIFYQGWWRDQGHKWNPISASSLARTGGVEERRYGTCAMGKTTASSAYPSGT